MNSDEKLTKYFSEVLTDVEKTKIENFCKDEELLSAVRKVLLGGIYTQGTIQKGVEIDPMVNGAFSLASYSISNPIPDAELGSHIKAMWAGVNYLKNALDVLHLIKVEKVEEVVSPYNEAE